MYTERDLCRIHRHSYRRKSERFIALMKSAELDENPRDNLGELMEIQALCDVCQREADEPLRFRVAVSNEDVLINRVVPLELLNLGRNAVLHAVERDTKFSADCFLQGKFALDVREAFMTIWVTTYVGYPDILVHAQGMQFTRKDCKRLVKDAGIEEHPSGVGSLHAIGVSKRYHAYL